MHPRLDHGGAHRLGGKCQGHEKPKRGPDMAREDEGLGAGFGGVCICFLKGRTAPRS